MLSANWVPNHLRYFRRKWVASRTTGDAVAAVASDAVAVVASAIAVGYFAGEQQLVSSRRHSWPPFVVSTLVEFVWAAVGRREVVDEYDCGWTYWSRICDED